MEGGTCIVLEGGAMRGAFTTGVLDGLLESNIPLFDCLVGVSSGAMLGINYAAGQTGHGLDTIANYCDDKRFMSLKSYVRTGNVLNYDFFKKVQLELEPFDREAFHASSVECFIVCTNVETGKPEYFRIDDMDDHVQFLKLYAGSSMPMASRIVEVDGYKLLDGGVADSIPIEWARARGFRRIVVVLTRPREFFMRPVRVMKAVSRRYRSYPQFVEAISKRPELWTRERNEVLDLERKGEAFVFAPSGVNTVKTVEHDRDAIERLYEEGRQQALARTKALDAFLEG